MSENPYDLAIVGASFAGLACGQAAAARGLRTIVLERKPEPGAAPRTTGLLVKELADEWDVPRRLTRKIHGVRLYAPSLTPIDLESPGYYFLATNTGALLRWFAAQANLAGVHVRNANTFRSAQRMNDSVTIDQPRIRCSYLVGADGARSAVASCFGLGRNTRRLIGVEMEFEGVSGIEEDRLHVFLDSSLAPGYAAWVVPGVGITQVGLACRERFKPRLDDFAGRVAKLFDFSRARLVGRRGGLIPVGGLVRPFAAERVMLIGDAAGMVSPLTAGGIHTAVHYGRCAGVAIANHLLDAGPDPARAMRTVLPSFFWKKLLRAAIDLRPPNALIDLAMATTPARALAQAIFYHHRGLFSLAAWRDAMLAWR